MSRVLISALALNILTGSVVFAQPLNINPFPMDKSAAVKAEQTPKITKKDNVEVIAIDAEAERLRIIEEQAVQEALAAEQAAARLQREKDALAAQKAAAAQKQKDALAQLEREKALLAAQIAAEEEAVRVERERIESANRIAEAEAMRLKQEKETLAAQLKEREAEKAALAAQVAAEEEVLRLERERVEVANRLAEEEAMRLKREQEELQSQLKVQEAEKAAKAKKQADEMKRLEQENVKLAEQLAKREEMKIALEAEQRQREQEMMLEKQHQAEAEALERENAKLAQQLDALEEQKSEPEIVLKKREVIAGQESAEVISLKEKNRELAEELRAQTEKKRKQAEIDMAMRALEAQKRADEAAETVAVQDAGYAPDVEPLFESASVQDNPVNMVPMPMESKPLRRSDVMEVRASDLGLVEPKLEATLKEPKMEVAREPDAQVASVVTPKVVEEPMLEASIEPSAPVRQRRVSRAYDYEAAGLTVIPYPGQGQNQNVQNVTYSSEPDMREVRSPYRSANAGESVEDVLRGWSQAEGVGFLWKTTRDFEVLKPVSAQGDYAASVQALLDQYEGQNTRPVAHLQTDPVTGTRTLSVLSE